MEVSVAAFLLLLLAAACADDLPTAPGEGTFPRVTRAETFVLEVAPGELSQELGAFTGYSGPLDVLYLMAANRFGGELEAHSLIRHTDFPTSITYTIGGNTEVDSAFVYTAGTLLAPIDTAASRLEGEVEFELWALGQQWDPGSASWEMASDTAGASVPWQQPGGTRARLLSTANWTPGDTLTGDTLSFAVDSLTVTEMAAEDFPGVLVRVNGAPARVQFGGMVLRTAVRPSAHPDTAIAQTITTGPQTFIFTPAPPDEPGVWEVGGIGSARVLLRLDVGRRFPCPRATGAPPCAVPGDSIRLVDVAVNQALLLLDAVPRADGYRPLQPMSISLRTVAEPELGRRAPLGALASQVTVQPQSFGPEGGQVPVSFPLLQYLLRLPEETRTVDLALLSEPDAGTFGMARFVSQVRLRVVYTLPLTPVLP